MDLTERIISSDDLFYAPSFFQKQKQNLKQGYNFHCSTSAPLVPISSLQEHCCPFRCGQLN